MIETCYFSLDEPQISDSSTQTDEIKDSTAESHEEFNKVETSENNDCTVQDIETNTQTEEIQKDSEVDEKSDEKSEHTGNENEESESGEDELEKPNLIWRSIFIQVVGGGGYDFFSFFWLNTMIDYFKIKIRIILLEICNSRLLYARKCPCYSRGAV